MKDPVAQLNTLRHEFKGLPFFALLLHSKCQVGHARQRVWVFLSSTLFVVSITCTPSSSASFQRP